MQFKLLAFAALVATAAAQNGTTNGTTPPKPGNGTQTPTPAPTSPAMANVVSGGLLGGIVAAGLALVL